MSKKKKADKRRGKKGNGKLVQFPQQPQPPQPPPNKEQMAQMKRIEVASQKILAAMDGLTIMEATGALKTIESMLQKRMSEFMQTEKLEAPNANNPPES